MLRRSLVTLAAVITPTLVAGAAVAQYSDGASPQAAASATAACGTRLASNLYSCEVTQELSPGLATFHDCYQATTATAGEQVDLTSVSAGGPGFFCDCNPTGSGTGLKFDTSTTGFTCSGTMPAGGTTPAALIGKVTAGGKRIVKGNIQVKGGLSFVLSCVVDPTCTP
jgi:hypothetical protein